MKFPEDSQLEKALTMAAQALRLAMIANDKADESSKILLTVQEEASEAWFMADEALGFVERY